MNHIVDVASEGPRRDINWLRDEVFSWPLLQGKLDPVVGRAKEIERVTQILGRRTKNNPCLIGEPGVGKTAVAEGLAQLIAKGDVPETIEGKQVCLKGCLSLTGFFCFCLRGVFNLRIKAVLPFTDSAACRAHPCLGDQEC